MNERIEIKHKADTEKKKFKENLEKVGLSIGSV